MSDKTPLIYACEYNRENIVDHNQGGIIPVEIREPLRDYILKNFIEKYKL